MPGAGRRLGEAEFQVRRRGLDLAQHVERRRHDFGADAVAGEDGDVEGVVGEHYFRALREVTYCGRMIFSENRCPLFGIMLYE